MHFIDEVVIRIESGRGGRGCESYFRRSDKKMVPTGGDGGRGGDVMIRAADKVASLHPFVYKKHFRAESGRLGGGNQKKGKDGKDLILEVPCGTTVFNKTHHLLIRDLAENGDEVTVVKGGRGGRGNRHGNDKATEGGDSEGFEVILSLKIKADVFLVGKPNSGKSLLLNRLTGSKVKTEPYPFTTQFPQLGIYRTEDFQSLTLCELPAILAGASRGKGLGNHFLKHLERARLILLMLDPLENAFDAVRGYNELLKEIWDYRAGWGEIPHFLVIGKADAIAKDQAAKLPIRVPCPVFFVSAETGEGIDSLMKEAMKAVSVGKEFRP